MRENRVVECEGGKSATRDVRDAPERCPGGRPDAVYVHGVVRNGYIYGYAVASYSTSLVAAYLRAGMGVRLWSSSERRLLTPAGINGALAVPALAKPVEIKTNSGIA